MKRKFDGKVYYFINYFLTKREAQDVATFERGKGNLSRITSYLVDRRYKRYAVWIRQGGK